MNKKNFKYIYGPVSSWRLGASLGIDPLSRDSKICSFDCIYCQIGKTDVLTRERVISVNTDEVLKEVKSLPDADIDYVTFSGRGEPTLAANLGEMIDGIREIMDTPIAVITNSTLLGREDVAEDLNRCDFVIAKLDAFDEKSFQAINRPHPRLNFSSLVEGIKKFQSVYKGKIGIQIMFTSINKEHSEEIADITREINPDQVQLNTPLRPCGIPPLPEDEMHKIKQAFKGLNVISVYEVENKKVIPLSEKETLKRRGKIK